MDLNGDVKQEVAAPVPQEKPKARQEKAQPKAEKPEATIYIGPNLPGGRLTSFRVFREGLPSYLGDLLQERPELKRLIVPLSSFQEARKRVATPGTIEHAAAAKMLERKGDQ